MSEQSPRRHAGTRGDDVIRGGRADDWIVGRDGADVLSGGEGDDVLFGGRFVDRDRSGLRYDVEDVGDLLLGGAGDDLLFGGSGDDRLAGGAGDDELFGELEAVDDSGADVDGVGRMRTLPGADRLDGGAGGDRLFGRGGDDHLAGGTGVDHLSGGAGADRLSGGIGRDVLIGGAGDDVLRGGNGADLFVVSMRESLRLTDLADEVAGGIDVIVDFTQSQDRIAVVVENGIEERQGAAAFDSNGDGRVDATDAHVRSVVDPRYGEALELDLGAAQAALGVPVEGEPGGRHVLRVVGVTALAAGDVVACPPHLG